MQALRIKISFILRTGMKPNVLGAQIHADPRLNTVKHSMQGWYMFHNTQNLALSIIEEYSVKRKWSVECKTQSKCIKFSRFKLMLIGRIGSPVSKAD